MECILAILFAFDYVFGTLGRNELLYVFSAVVLLFYMWKRHNKFFQIIEWSIPIAIICMIMIRFYPNIYEKGVIFFLGRMMLNYTLMLYVASNCKKWKMEKFVSAVVTLFAGGTVCAVIFPNSQLWTSENLINVTDSVPRLKLFFANAGILSFACGFILILLVYQIITEDVIWKQVVGVLIVATDIFLSYGIGGVMCALMAVSFMLFLEYVYKYKHLQKKINKSYFITWGLVCIGIVGALATNSIYVGRLKNIIVGTDYILITKLLNPLRNITGVLKATKYLGVGFGNANSEYALSILNANEAYPNSFLRIIAEGGVFGIILVMIVVFGLGYLTYKYGTVLDRALCAYVLVFQFTGGNFTDPVNYFIYGLIIGSCIQNKIEATGKTRIKLFMPVVKEKLSIAQIGHKRLYGREGGVEIVVEEISKRLVKKGHGVDVYNRSGNHVSGEKFNLSNDLRYKADGIKQITIPTIQKKGVAALVYSFLASLYVVTKDYDVIHYHAEGPCAFIWIPSYCGIRTVATIHGLDWQRTDKWGSFASEFIKFGERMAVKNADEIIVLSKNVQNYFMTNYNRKTNFIPNGVNRPELSGTYSIKTKWGLESRKYILLLARLTHEKGFHYAVSAFRNIDTDMKLVIAGGASDSDEYVKKLRELAGNDERIVFTGFVRGDDLSELYTNAYVYCLPSDLEGMPISLLEAMSYGNCCLVSDIPECTSVVGEYGVAFSQGNIISLQNELEYLIENPKVVEKYRNKSADYICEKYRWDEVVDKTIELYRDELVVHEG